MMFPQQFYWTFCAKFIQNMRSKFPLSRRQFYKVINNTKQAMLTKPLYEQLLTITPQSFPTIFPQLTTLLCSPTPFTDYRRLWKGLFLGLWNYDKMINQHQFNTSISGLLHLIPFQRAVLFLNEGLKRLQEYWERIDHHRINKFNQLLRYLIREGMAIKSQEGNVLEVVEHAIIENVFVDKEMMAGSGLAVLAVYVDVLLECGRLPTVANVQWAYNLMTLSKNKDYRAYIIEHLFEKVKKALSPEQITNHINHALGLTKTTQQQPVRKSLYDLVGFLKSPEQIYEVYMEKKIENRERGALRSRKRLTKGKRQQITKLKEKRKGTKKQPKKIISKNAMEMRME